MTRLSRARNEASEMVRKMKMREIESQVSAFGNGGHVIVPKDWIGKKVRVTLIED